LPLFFFADQVALIQEDEIALAAVVINPV